MICPECKNEPFSILKFFINGTRRTISCNNCGTNLQATKSLKRGNFIMMSVLVLTLIIIINSGKILDYQISFVIGSPIIMAVWIISMLLLWSRGTLEKLDKG